jgi:predicted lipid-binding transport protein (Tim44 family)
MLPVAGPGGTFTFAARPGMQQPFFYPAVPQPVPTSAPTPASAAAAAGAAGRRPSSRPSRSSSSAAAGKKHCNCKNSRCLKL